MRAILFAVCVLVPSFAFAQALPGGTYVLPSSPAMESYEPQHKERFTVHVVGLIKETDTRGRPREVEKVIGKYLITDSQWPGLKKNIAKFCKQQKAIVSKIEPGEPVRVYLIPAPPPPVEPPVIYPKGTGATAKK